jgi:hypothetical protein
MSTIKVAFGTATAFTKTNANLAASTTNGWVSNAIDNTSTLALDALIHVELAAVNTAPGGSKAIFLYAYALVDGSAAAYTGTGGAAVPSGSEATMVFPAVTTLPVVMPLLGIIPYPVQNIAINAGPFSVAKCFGGILPPKWGIGMVNDSGMTLSVTNIKYTEITNTVA